MNKYAVLVTSYPSEKNPAVFGFVHSRVKEYIKHGLNVDVLRISNSNNEYFFEGVRVIEGNPNELLRIARTNKYKKLLVHLMAPQMNVLINEFPVIAWVHGVEALHWKRRLFNLRLSFPKYIMTNIKQLSFFRGVVKSKDDISFVFVSQWMRDIAMEDIRVPIDNYSIIPNYINDDEFSFSPKKDDQKNRILIIRSFSSKKYANDISVEVIKALSNRPYFDRLQFTIYGEGKLFDKTLKPIRNYKNVEIHNTFVQHSQISQLHKSNGVFLCPTRQDAQGVSMCEAMCSGLVPITSNNTAIPEFLDKSSGFLCSNHSVESFVKAFDILQNDSVFCKLSENASKSIRNKCGYDYTIRKEIDLIIKE